MATFAPPPPIPDEEEEVTGFVPPPPIADEEEESPETKPSAKFVPPPPIADEVDPIKEYNSTASIAETFSQSFEKNMSRYNELAQNPERSPEQIKEMVSAWRAGKEAEIGLYSEQEKLETLRPEVDRINAERQQARVNQIENLRLDPAFGDEVAEQLYQYDQSLQEEIAQAREIPDPAEREEAISTIAKRYGEQETSMLRTALENNFKRFDAVRDVGWLTKQLEINNKAATKEYTDKVSDVSSDLLFETAESLGVSQEAWRELQEKRRTNETQTEAAIEEILSGMSPERQKQVREEAKEWLAVQNAEKEVAIIQGRPIFSGDVQDDPERQREILDELLEEGEINEVQHKSSLEAMESAAEQTRNNKLEFFRTLPDYEERLSGKRTQKKERYAGGLVITVDEVVYGPKMTEEEALEEYEKERGDPASIAADYFRSFKESAAEYVPMALEGQDIENAINSDDPNEGRRIAFEIIQNAIDKQREADPFLSKGAQIAGGVGGQVGAQIAVQGTAQAAFRGIFALISLLAPHPAVKAAGRAGSSLFGLAANAAAMANIYGFDYFQQSVQNFLQTANVESVDDLSEDQKKQLYKEATDAFNVAKVVALGETVEPTIFINMPPFMRKKMIGRLVDGGINVGAELGQEIAAEAYKESYFRNFTSAHQARSPIDGEEIGYMAAGLIPLGGARFVKTSIDVRRENTRDERLKEINKYNAARAEELRAEKALIDAAEQAALNAEGAAPASAEAMKGMVEASKDELDTKIEDVGVEPTVPVTPPVEPTPEGAVAPVEPVVEPVVAEPPPAAEVAVEPVPEEEKFNNLRESIGASNRLVGDVLQDKIVYSTVSEEGRPEAELVIEESEVNPNRVILETIFTPPEFRGRGLANQKMQDFIQNVDRLGMDVQLSVDPESASKGVEGESMTRDQLKDWYKKYGFFFPEDSDVGFRASEATKERLRSTTKTYDPAVHKIPPDENWYSDTETLFSVFRDNPERFQDNGIYVVSNDAVYVVENEKLVRIRDVIFDYDYETKQNIIKPNANIISPEAKFETAAPAVTPPAEVAPTPETPNLEPLRRVARAEQAPEDIPSLVEAGLVEVYKDQPVLTDAGLAALPEAERPRLTPEARKIQIDTGANEVVAEAIAKNLRIGVDQVGPNVTLPAGWTLDGDIYVPPEKQIVFKVEEEPTPNLATKETAPTVEQFKETKSDYWVPEVTKKEFDVDKRTGKSIDVQKLWEQVKEKRPQPIKLTKEYIENNIEFRDLNEESLAKANVSHLGLATFEINPQDPRKTVGVRLIDGWHRAKKALDEGRDFWVYPVEAENSTIENAYAWGEKYNGLPQVAPSPAPEVRESRREPAPLTQQDREYLDAVERGDLDAGSKAVEQAAKEAGYTQRWFHGTAAKAFNVFRDFGRKFIYFTQTRGDAMDWAKNNVEYARPEYAQGETPTPRVVEAFINADNIFNRTNEEHMNRVVDLMSKSDDRSVKNQTPQQLKEFLLEENYEWYEEVAYKFIRQAGFDGAYIFESQDFDPYNLEEADLGILNPNQIKSADPVTRDSQGNIIPLSQRFQPTEEDIRYARREPSVEARQQYAPKTEEEQKAFDKASSNKVLARSPQLAVAAVRMKNGEITSGEYADLVDAIDPFTAKGADPIPTKEKIQQYISSDKAGQVMQPIESGKEVEFRIDIPTYNRSTAAGDTVYAVTAHEPVAADAKGVGKVISFVGVAKVNNPTFMTRAISGRGTAADIAAGAGKFPLATVKGNYEPITDLPADINDPNVWTEVGYNPIRSSFFVDTRSKDAVVGGSEAIMVGSRVFVKDAVLEPRPTGVTMGERYAQIQMPRPAGMETEAVTTKLESLGFGRGGIVSVVNEPNASFEGRTIIRDGKVVGIELNAAALKDDGAVERVLNHEIAESANADGALNNLVAGLTPKERKEINDAITRLGYSERARTAEEAARAVELLAEGWRGRRWFERAVARVEAWANKLGYKLTRRAAEYIAARNVSEINAEFKQAYNKFITPSSQEGAVIRESRREDAIPTFSEGSPEASNAENNVVVTQRAEAKKAQELVTGHSILADEVPAELREEAQASYQNGMTLGDFLNPELFNLGEAYQPYIAATWLELNGGLMPTVKVEGKDIAKPEKGTSEAEALRLLKRASDILDSRSETAGGKELTYSLQDIMATWMESGLGPAALKNAIVQFTNLDVAQADKTANDFANVYQLAQNVTDSKERARVRMDRALPAVTARQQREKERMIKLEEAAGSIDSIAEAIRIAYDIGVKKPKTDKATEKKQIEEQLRQAKQILRDVVPKEYLGDQLTTLQGATGIEGLKKVVEAAQNGLNEARLDEAVAGAKKSFDRAQKAIKANNIGPEAMAVLRDFVETYSKKGIGPETKAKIEEAISRYEADPVGALQDLATEKYLKQKGALGAIKIDKSLGLDALKEITRMINATLHADKVARGEMLFNKKQTRQEVISGISEEIDNIKSISKARKDGGQGIGLFNKVAIYKGARVENILRAFGLNKLSELVYDNLTLDAYQDELRVRRDLKKKIESRVKEITGLDIGTKAYDLYSKETIELTGVDSAGRTKPIKVRRYELLDILASLRDPSNLRRAVNSGGYVIDRLDLAEVDTVKITPETYQEILNKATDQDNQMVDMMVELYNNDLFQILENASVQAYGHGIKAVSGTYYPRTADKWTRATEVKKDLDYIAYYQRRVDDVGYLKERDERSKSKLRAVDFLERLDYHVTNDSRIGAYLPIVRDIEMVLGDPAIARPLASKIGEDGLTMIREMVRQQTTPPAGLPAGILSTLVGNAGVGVLGFKLHAAMQNPVGIPIATAYYGKDGYKYLAKAFPAGIKALKPSDAKEMNAVLSKYSPYYNERYGDGGFIQEFTSGLSNAPSNRKWRKNLETAAMSWLEGTDRWGAHVRYQLAQQVIQDRTTLEKGTEAFNQAVAREWTKMMFRSENTAHGGDRTGAFQFAGRHPVFKIFIMFQSAVSKQYSLFAEAMLKAQQGGKENLKDAAYQLTFLSISLAASRAISNAFYSMLFPPEEDEEQTWSQLLGKVAGTPLSIVPVVGNTLQGLTETLFSPENKRKPMQIDLISSFIFGVYDTMLMARKALDEVSEDKIDEVTGNPKFWETSYRMVKKAAGLAGIAYGTPLAGVIQTGELGFKLKERVTETFNDEPKTEDFQKKVKEYEKEQRSEPVTQEYAKLFFAVADDNQKQFNRALKDLKAKRPDIKRQDLINAIRRRPEFRVVGMVRSGKLKQRDLEANGISRDYYLTQKALLRSMEEAAKTMYRDSKD